MNEVTKEHPRLTPMGRFAVLAILSMLPVFIVFAILGKPATGMGVCVCVAIMAFAVRPYWPLRNSAGFWLAMVVAVFIQIPFVVYVPWSNRYYRGGALLPFALLDYIIVYGCFKLTQKSIRRANRPETSD